MYGGRILGRNWGKSLKEFSSLLFAVSSTYGFTPPPSLPLSNSGLKLVCHVNLVRGTSNLRTQWTRNLNETRRSWIRLQAKVFCHSVQNGALPFHLFAKVVLWTHLAKTKLYSNRYHAEAIFLIGWNPDISAKSVPPCYLQSPLQLCFEIFFFKLTQPLTFFFKLTQPLTYFYSSVTETQKGGKPNRKP
jgi:hypothetical protein